MQSCHHQTLDFVGEQRTEEGANAYYRCKECGVMVVLTPSNLAFTVKSVPQSGPHVSRVESSSS